jgi:hypothetical protein
MVPGSWFLVGVGYVCEITHPMTLSNRISTKTKIETSHPDKPSEEGSR